MLQRLLLVLHRLLLEFLKLIYVVLLNFLNLLRQLSVIMHQIVDVPRLPLHLGRLHYNLQQQLLQLLLLFLFEALQLVQQNPSPSLAVTTSPVQLLTQSVHLSPMLTLQLMNCQLQTLILTSQLRNLLKGRLNRRLRGLQILL